MNHAYFILKLVMLGALGLMLPVLLYHGSQSPRSVPAAVQDHCCSRMEDLLEEQKDLLLRQESMLRVLVDRADNAAPDQATAAFDQAAERITASIVRSGKEQEVWLERIRNHTRTVRDRIAGLDLMLTRQLAKIEDLERRQLDSLSRR